MKIVGDLVLTEDYHIDDDLTVEGDIKCEGGLWNLTCWDLNCENLDCLESNLWIKNKVKEGEINGDEEI